MHLSPTSKLGYLSFKAELPGAILGTVLVRAYVFKAGKPIDLANALYN